MAAPGIAVSLALAAASASPAQPGAAAPPPAMEAAPAPVETLADDPAPAEPSPVTAAPTGAGTNTSLDDIDLAAPRPFPDPLEDISRISYAISQPIDRIVLRPLAMTYKAVVPKPLRDGARNMIGNATDPVVLVNDLLQLRPDRALRTLSRFLINSTFGMLGLFDVAKRKPFDLPHRNNGFGNTLGYYGIGPIAYFYLPVLGPTTLRDSAAQFGDSFVRDRVIDKALYPDSGRSLLGDSPRLGTPGTIVTVVEGLDLRAENDAELRSIQEDSIDPYAALRASYLQDRAGEIAALKSKDGIAPEVDGFKDPLIDPEAGAPPDGN